MNKKIFGCMLGMFVLTIALSGCNETTPNHSSHANGDDDTSVCSSDHFTCVDIQLITNTDEENYYKLYILGTLDPSVEMLVGYDDDGSLITTDLFVNGALLSQGIYGTELTIENGTYIYFWILDEDYLPQAQATVVLPLSTGNETIDFPLPSLE